MNSTQYQNNMSTLFIIIHLALTFSFKYVYFDTIDECIKHFC